MQTSVGMENYKKHSLGRRAFLLFFSKRIKGVTILFVLAIALWYGERWVPAAYLPWAGYAVNTLSLFAVLYLLAMLFWTWLEYRFYTYMFTEDAFIMTSGYVIRNEVATLYHQIQNVNIQRRPIDRMIGVSQIVIFMAGGERESLHNKIVLPAVGRTKAGIVQKELLRRARRHAEGSYQEYRDDGSTAGTRNG